MTQANHDPPDNPARIDHRLLLDEVGAFVYTADVQGRYTYANRLVLELLGHPLEAILGKTFAQVFGKDHLDDALDETDRLVLREGQTITREESHTISGSKATRTFLSIKKPLRDAAGTVVGLLGISYDITDKVQLESQVREQKYLLDTVLDNIDALVYMKGADRRFLYVNRPTAKAFKRAAEDIIGHLDSEFMPPEVAERFWRIDQEILETRQRHASEETVLDAEGRPHHYWSVIVPWLDSSGPPAVIGMSTDITELHALKEQLEQQARTDGLTGIANRRWFFELAEREYARSRRSGLPLSLISVDIDHFKHINDSYGHPVGDRVLQDFVSCCSEVLREVDVFARTGGEEFCILLPDTPTDLACEVAERIRALTRACHPLPDYPDLRITASFGISSLDADDPDFHTLFARSDRAMYLAKAAGRDCCHVLQAA